jgi:hypothetical protein
LEFKWHPYSTLCRKCSCFVKSYFCADSHNSGVCDLPNPSVPSASRVSVPLGGSGGQMALRATPWVGVSASDLRRVRVSWPEHPTVGAACLHCVVHLGDPHLPIKHLIDLTSDNSFTGGHVWISHLIRGHVVILLIVHLYICKYACILTISVRTHWFFFSSKSLCYSLYVHKHTQIDLLCETGPCDYGGWEACDLPSSTGGPRKLGL